MAPESQPPVVGSLPQKARAVCAPDAPIDPVPGSLCQLHSAAIHKLRQLEKANALAGYTLAIPSLLLSWHIHFGGLLWAITLDPVW